LDDSALDCTMYSYQTDNDPRCGHILLQHHVNTSLL